MQNLSVFFGGVSNSHILGGDYRYTFNGMEKDDEVKGDGNSYTTHFRQYDPRIARWASIDPKATSFESPYTSMGGNPVLNMDPLGDTTFRFNDATGVYMGMSNLHLSGVEGVFVKQTQVEVTTNGVTEVVNKEEITGTFQFGDRVNDPKAIIKGDITSVIRVKESDITTMLQRSGAFDPDNKTLDYINTESPGGGNLDFSYTQIPNFYSQASKDPLKDDASVLFIMPTKDGGQTIPMAYNQMNFGNYLWGAAGEAMGWGLSTLLWAADYNSLFNSPTNGYEPQWDSFDDQISIIFGWYHAKKNSYDKMEEQGNGNVILIQR